MTPSFPTASTAFSIIAEITIPIWVGSDNAFHSAETFPLLLQYLCASVSALGISLPDAESDHAK